MFYRPSGFQSEGFLFVPALPFSRFIKFWPLLLSHEQINCIFEDYVRFISVFL